MNKESDARCHICGGELSVASRQPDRTEYAGFAVRVCACAADWLLVLLASALPLLAVTALRFAGARFAPDSRASILVSALIVIPLWTAYNLIALARFGTTLGKRLFGVRVLHKNGEPCDFVSSFVRIAFGIVSVLFVFPLIGYLFVPFRRSKQGFHDQLAGTVAVTKNPGRKAVVCWTILATVGGTGVAATWLVLNVYR